jgi:hypothetical protein
VWVNEQFVHADAFFTIDGKHAMKESKIQGALIRVIENNIYVINRRLRGEMFQ